MSEDAPTGPTREEEALRYARVLPLDVVEAKGSGHAGTAVGLAPFLFTLFQEYLKHDPAHPSWIGRDRFVLSCGHTSLSLYLQLFLHGYGLEMDDLKATRTIDSITPGHPEYGHTPGVETTTGPLGQGVGNAVGMAIAARRVRGMFHANAEIGTSPFDHRVFCLVSDGDLQEGVSHEASALAGNLGLNNLIMIWDDNEITIEGATSVTTKENTMDRMAAYGWKTYEINNAESISEIRKALDYALSVKDSPVFIRLKSKIGNPMPNIGGTAAAHAGAVGKNEVYATKKILGIDPSAAFQFPDELLQYTRQKSRLRGDDLYTDWETRFQRWKAENPSRADKLARVRRAELPDGWDDGLSWFEEEGSLPTRVASAETLTRLGQNIEEMWGGSADLAGTNGTWSAEFPSFLPPNLESAEWPGNEYGRVLHFGVREHAMGAILNGIALNGLTRVFGATFFVFSDYMRPAVRLAALMSLPVLYVWTHDSVAVGEDGPTHEPVEHLWASRAIPGLAVVRPGDANETVAAYRHVLTENRGPTAMVLSRQAVPTVGRIDIVREGVARGGYVLVDVDGTVDLILIATGSELHLAVDCAAILHRDGVGVRVVSMPCVEWFDEQDEDYRDSVLLPGVSARVSVEAGVAQGWYRFIGNQGEAVSVEGFGMSGDGQEVLRRKGVTREAIIDSAWRVLRRTGPRQTTDAGRISTKVTGE